jgi:hypothetical protein
LGVVVVVAAVEAVVVVAAAVVVVVVRRLNRGKEPLQWGARVCRYGSEEDCGGRRYKSSPAVGGYVFQS